MAKYKYNGVKLPALPEWDKETYPYAYIVESGEAIKDYQLVCLTAEWSYLYNPTDTNYIAAQGAGGIMYDDYASGWNDLGELEVGEGQYIKIHSDTMTPIWSNFDILNEDGTVYLAASEPVRIFDLRSFLTGLALGLAGKPLPLTKREPVAYLYNGVQLPLLPEYDKEKFPYVHIHTSSFSGLWYEVNATSVPLENRPREDDSSDLVPVTDGARYIRMFIEPDATDWTVNAESDFTGIHLGGALSHSVIWTNTDIYNEDGTLYFAASEPVPVYE